MGKMKIVREKGIEFKHSRTVSVSPFDQTPALWRCTLARMDDIHTHLMLRRLNVDIKRSFRNLYFNDACVELSGIV